MISSTSQINTFIAGMDTDTDVNFLPNNKYRYAQDVRIVTDDQGTTGVLQSVDGAKKYNYGIKITEEVIGTATINDIALVVTKLTDGYNKVYRIENFNSPNLTSTVILQGQMKWCSSADSNQLSIVLNFETNANIKAYFTDGNATIKVINIMDDKYVKYPNVDNPLLDEDGNILNPDSLDSIPNATLPPFEITEITTGNFNAGMVQHCYRLYNKNSQQTAISSLSNCVHLDASDVSTHLINHFGSQKGASTGKGCTMSAPLVTKDFNRCQIIRIFYEDNNATPIYTLVDDISVDTTKDTITYTDTGNDGMSTMTQEEFNATTSYSFVCNSITSLQNRLFAANVTESSWVPMIEDGDNLVEYDARVYRANSTGYVRIETSDPNDYMYFKIDSYDDMKRVPEQHDCINPYNSTKERTSSNEYIYGLNHILGGNGINIEYEFVNLKFTETEYYLSGSAGYGSDDVGITLLPSNVSEIPIFELNGSQITSQKITSANRLENYADPILASLYRSYQRDEVYRFGIVFYNKKAEASPVLWIGDIRFPDLQDAPTFTFSDDYLYSKPVGIRFRVKNFPVDAVAYEIVRCDRDQSNRTILTQGVLTTLHNYKILETYENGEIGRGESNQETSDYRAMPFLHHKERGLKIKRGGATSSEAYMTDIAEEYWRFISPEVCFNGEELESLLKDGTYLYKQQILTTQFSTDGLETSGYDVTRNWIGMNSRTYQPDGDYMVTKDQRKKTFVYTPTPVGDSQCQIFQFQNEDFYNAYVQKFFNTRMVTQNRKIQSIVDAKYPPIIPYNAVLNGGVKEYKVNIGGITYANWTASEFNLGGQGDDVITYGPAGPCLILRIDQNDIDVIRPISWNYEDHINDDCPVTVVNVKRSIVPYGGNTYSARTNSVYIPTFSYKQIDNSVSSGSISYVFGGDTYLGILDYPAQMIFQRNELNDWRERKRYFGAYIPCESSINLKLSYGEMAYRTYNAAMNTIDQYLQIEPVQMQQFHSQTKPYYLYNDVYSTVPDGKQYVASSQYDEANVKSPNRIYVSQAKTPNENIDSWTVFKTSDFIDVDAAYGEITNIRGIANRLYFWQGNAFGILSVNDRSLVQDNNIGQLVLGTGGVLDRYDYISTINGTSIINDRSITNSDSSIYWYDVNKNEICKYGNGGINVITKECNLQSYMNNMYEQKTKGANSLYDRKYNEVWFKLYDRSLIYNERLNAFTSLYTFEPDFTLSFRDKVVAINDNNFYIINSLNIDGFGDTTKDSRLKIVVNKDPQYTKIFDNIALQGNFVAPDNKILTSDILESAIFTTKHQTSTRKGEDLVFDYREDTYRLPVPRQDDFDAEGNMSFPARMKGKYMVCDYKFKSSNDYTFEVPQITTTYRYSRI